MFAGEDNRKLAILLFIISIKPSVKFGMWNLSLALFSQSEVTIPSEKVMLGFYHVIKLQDFLYSSEVHIKNNSKVDEINTKVRNGTELNLVGYESKVYQIKI